MIQRLALLALFVGASPLCPVAEAKEASALDQAEFERVFGHMRRDIDSQIRQKGSVFPETIERTRKNVEQVIARIERSGADPAPYRGQVDTFLASVQERANAALLAKNQGKINTSVPNVKPLPGIETIPEGAPTWCEPIVAQHGGAVPTSADLRLPEIHAEVQASTLQTVLRFSCALPDFAPSQQWTRAYRQRLSNLLGFTVSENEAFLKRAAALYDKDDRTRPEAEAQARCAPLPGKKDGLIEQRLHRDLERGTVGCGSASGAIEMQFPLRGLPMWLVDLPAGPDTELAKLGLSTELLSGYVQRASHLFDPSTAPDPNILLEGYGLAQTVAATIDREALKAEVAALDLDPVARLNVDIFVAGELHVLEIVRRFAEDAAKSNPNLRAVYLDGPNAGVAAYREQQAGAAKALDLLLAIEDRIGPDPGGSDGCSQALYGELRPWLQEQVKAGGVSQPQDLRFDDLRGALLYQGLLTCGTHDATAPTLAHVVEELYGPSTNTQRGPISAAYQGMLDAYNDTIANPAPKAGGFSTARGQTQTVVDLAPLHRNPVVAPQLGRKLGPYLDGVEKRGVIASISDAGAGFSQVQFRTESVQRPIRDCRETGRIARIDENGRLVPEYDCRTTGWETVKVTNDPILMPGWLAADLAAGQLLAYRASKSIGDKPSYGWPLAAYSNGTGKTLVAMLGVPVR